MRKVYFNGSLLLATCLMIYSCGKSRTSNRQSKFPHNESSILANVAGIDSQDKNLAGLEYQLICDNLKAVIGKPLNEQSDTTYVTFSSTQLKNGLSCAIEVRATPKDDIAWLTAPEEKGLYYGSDKTVIKDHKLKLTLFKLYKSKTVDEDPSVTVTTRDGGTCENYDVSQHRCLDEDSETPNTSTSQERFGAELELTEKLSLRVISLTAEGSAKKNGLQENDEITLAGGQEITTLENFYLLLDEHPPSATPTWVNILRDGSSQIIWLEQ